MFFDVRIQFSVLILRVITYSTKDSFSTIVELRYFFLVSTVHQRMWNFCFYTNKFHYWLLDGIEKRTEWIKQRTLRMKANEIFCSCVARTCFVLNLSGVYDNCLLSDFNRKQSVSVNAKEVTCLIYHIRSCLSIFSVYYWSRFVVCISMFNWAAILRIVIERDRQFIS